MNTFMTLLRREIGSTFLSPVAYVVMCFFLAVMGFSFWMMAQALVDGARESMVLRELFASFFFWMVNLIVIPAITMRTFSEEKKEGTLEALMTTPVTDLQVVLAKFFGALFFYVLLWLPTLSYLSILHYFSAQSLSFDSGILAACYFGAFLVGAFFIAIGILCSSLTKNQVIAAVMSFAIISLIFLAGFSPYLSHSASAQFFGRYFSCVMHMFDFSRGMIDSRPVIFYLSSIVVVLFAAVRSVESRKWK
jgi:ABC-2 type transport system permease protein